jgi:hypothetical protein
MIRTPERFAFVVLMLCLIAAWAGFLPFDMNQMFVAYTIFWVAWSAWILLEWWRCSSRMTSGLLEPDTIIRCNLAARASWIMVSTIGPSEGMELERFIGDRQTGTIASLGGNGRSPSGIQRVRGEFVSTGGFSTTLGLALKSSSKTQGTMTTARGRCPFSNIANRSASARSMNRPPQSPCRS